jgi:hypothetical protein
MHLQIPHLGIVEYLTDVVDRALYGLNPLGGGSSASTSIGSATKGSRSLGRAAASRSWDLVVPWSLGLKAASRSWDSLTSWSLGHEVASRSWDSAACWFLGPEMASRSWGPDGVLILGTRSGLWELGPDLGFGARGRLRELDLEASLS